MFKFNREGARSFGVALVAALLAAAPVPLLSAVAAPHSPDKQPHFTSQQASAGKQVYAAQCAKCHKSDLSGGAGPALRGKKFASSLQYSKMSATQLFNFIAQHMPKNQPGSLSQQQYLQVFAYILSRNGFPADGTKLDRQVLSRIDLLPLPSAQSGNTR